MEIDIRSFAATASAIKNSRKNSSDSTVEIPKESLADIVAAATAIKENRKGVLLEPKPIPVQRFAHYSKAFVCRNSEGRELSVGVTDHAFERFARRYQYYDSFFLPASIEQVEKKMREVFNKGHFLPYNPSQKYDRDTIQWVSGSVCFIVNIKRLQIVTVYLTGEFDKFNQHPWRFLPGELKCKLFAM